MKTSKLGGTICFRLFNVKLLTDFKDFGSLLITSVEFNYDTLRTYLYILGNYSVLILLI
jgi:hypothetical protein